MNGKRAVSRDGIGGFTEAVLALMVVTLAVILFSASLSLTGVEMMEEKDGSSLSVICEEVWAVFTEDDMIWEGDAVVLTSFGSRASEPYAIPGGSFGYEVALIGLIDNSSTICISGGMPVDGADIHTERHAVLVKTDSGMEPGIVEVRVW